MTDHILVPMDSSPMAKRALEHALSTRPDARVTVLYVIDYIEESYSARALVGTEKLRERAQQRAEKLFKEATEIADEFDEAIETETVVGDPAREIVAYAEDHDIDQIIIGSHGRDEASPFLLGSVTETVVFRSPVRVLLVR